MAFPNLETLILRMDTKWKKNLVAASKALKLVNVEINTGTSGCKLKNIDGQYPERLLNERF